MSTTFRVVMTIQESIDIEVPDEEMAKGFERAQDYARKVGEGCSPLLNSGMYSYGKILRIDAYLKDPYKEYSK